MPHDERAEALRQRIALYRRYLRDGIDAALAEHYLRQIATDLAELAKIRTSNAAPGRSADPPAGGGGPRSGGKPGR